MTGANSHQSKSPRRRVVLLGKGTLAIRVAEWFRTKPGYELIAVVPVVPEPAWTDSLSEWARGREVPYVSSGDVNDIPGVHRADWRCDLAFSVFYDRIIRGWMIEKCGRILNLHNGPLPRYRGVSPINWALKNGESTHGVTIHEITTGVDDGPIVAQLHYSIYPEVDEVRDVYLRSLEYGWVLFQQTMPLLDQIIATPQHEAEASHYRADQNRLLGERRYFTRTESLERMDANALSPAG